MHKWGMGGSLIWDLVLKNDFLLLPYFWTLVGGWAVVGSPGEAEAQNKSLPGQPHQTNQKQNQQKSTNPTKTK